MNWSDIAPSTSPSTRCTAAITEGPTAAEIDEALRSTTKDTTNVTAMASSTTKTCPPPVARDISIITAAIDPRAGEQGNGEWHDGDVVLRFGIVEFLGAAAAGRLLRPEHVERREQEEDPAGHSKGVDAHAQHVQEQPPADGEEEQDARSNHAGAERDASNVGTERPAVIAAKAGTTPRGSTMTKIVERAATKKVHVSVIPVSSQR